MPYYPKSQIKTNLYTNGNELILSTTNNTYQGYYYEISNGKKYTGKTPKDGPNILLSPVPPLIQQLIQIPYPEDSPIIIQTTEIVPIQIPEYVIQNTPTVRSIPLFNPTLPTDQDKQNGQFNRYFCKKTNELKYLEIDKETYTKLQAKDLKIAWDLYEPASLLWVIKGNQETVFNTNKTSVFKIEQNQKWYGFSQYFRENYLKYHPSQDTELLNKNKPKENYLKYYQLKDINNLYTSGGEFTTKNGQNYIGFYHIHRGTIPMAGKTHTQYYHETLIPTQLSLNKNSKFSQILASIALALDNTGNPTSPVDPTNSDNPDNLINPGDSYDPYDPDKIPPVEPFFPDDYIEYGSKNVVRSIKWITYYIQ